MDGSRTAVVTFYIWSRGREEDDRMEVIGSEQRQEDPSFFELHWEEETARRWERREVGTTRQEELKIRLRLSSLSQRGLSTDERRRTATPMQNVLTFKLEDGGVGGGNRSTGFDISTDLLEEGGNRSSGTASSDEDNNSPSLGGVADERSKTNSHHDADAYSNDYGDLTNKDNVLGGGNRSTGFVVHGLIRRTWRWRYDKLNIGISSTSCWSRFGEDVGDLEDIRKVGGVNRRRGFWDFVLGQIVRTFVDYE